MREFNFQLDESLAAGLVAPDKVRRNTPGLLECFNLKSKKEGLLEFSPITDPFTGYSIHWPYPQMFQTKTGVFAAEETEIFEVDPWNVFISKISGLTAGNRWSLADFYNYQIWVNGATCVIKDPATDLMEEVLLDHTIESVCNFNGQLVAGGFGGDKSNFVAWSGIGKTYLTEMLTKEDRTNVTGNMPVGWAGDVYVVKQLGSNIIVYGSGGISALKPISHPAVGFALIPIFDHGIAGKGAVGGDSNIHLFIDNTGALYSINSIDPKRLGYKQFMTNLVPQDITISFDPIDREFYISDGVKCYLLSDGLSEIYQLPTGVVSLGGNCYSPLYVPGTQDTSAYLTTNTIDCGLRAIKTITAIEASFDSTAVNAQVAIDYAYKTSDAFTRSMLKNVNKQGVVTPLVSGVDLRVHFTIPSHVGFEIDNMVVRWKLSDKRSIRGTYGDQRNL